MRGVHIAGGAVAVLAACAPLRLPPSQASPLLGAPAPEFRRPTVQGSAFASGAAGQVLVVEFFAEYCAPCQLRLAQAERLRAAHPDLALVGVSLDESPDAAAAAVRRHRLSFPVVHDAGHVLAGRYRVTALPAAFVVSEGIVRWVGGPGQPDRALADAIRAALEAGTE
jgi:peroxiredoxin